MRAPTAANQFHAPVPRWNSRSRASSSSNGILPAAAFASTRRPGGAAAPATRSKSVRIKKMAPSGCPLHGTAIPVARRPVDWRRTIRRGGGLEGIGGAWTGHAQHQTRRVAISRAEGDGQAGRNNGVGTLESTGRVSPDLVPIEVALSRAKRKDGHRRAKAPEPASPAASPPPKPRQAPMLLARAAREPRALPAAPDVATSNRVSIWLDSQGASQSPEAFVETRQFAWSEEGYSAPLRSLSIWCFIIQARAGLFLLDQKWSYPGGFDDAKKSRRATVLGAWLRDNMLALGPTFIKIGQLFSARSDLLAPEVVNELSKLQDRVPSFRPELARKIVERELGGRIEDLFASFDAQPIAAASLGQVHRARLFTGEDVVVKVQRPGLEKLFAIDLGNLEILARQLDAQEEGRDFTGIFQECKTILFQEVDYIAEGRNADRFRRNFNNNTPWVRVPRVYWQLSSPRILTLEYLPGTKITDLGKLKEQNQDLSLLARRMTECYLTQLLRHGFFHADPHPGNLAVDAQGNLVFYDFGMMGEIVSNVRENLLEVFYGIYGKDTQQVLDALIALEIVKPTGDLLSVRRSVSYFLDTFTKQTQREETIRNIGEDLFAIALDQPFRFPATFTFVLRAFSTLEGIGKRLDDSYRFSVVATPYFNELLAIKDASQRGQLVLTQLQQQVEAQADAAAQAPTRIARIGRFVDSLEVGDLKLRVRVLESERAARRAGIMQAATLDAVGALGFLNLGTQLFLAGKDVPATSMMILTAVFALRMTLGFRRVRNIDRFEKGIRG